MRIDSYHGPVNEAFAAQVATLAQKDPTTVQAIDVARALRSNLVACLWYENGVQKLEAVAAMQCIESLTGEKLGRITEVYASAMVSPDQVTELIAFLMQQGVRWGAREIHVDGDACVHGVDLTALQLLYAHISKRDQDATSLAPKYPM